MYVVNVRSLGNLCNSDVGGDVGASRFWFSRVMLTLGFPKRYMFAQQALHFTFRLRPPSHTQPTNQAHPLKQATPSASTVFP